MNNITDSQKIFELSKIWKEAAYNFVFWDKVEIDWDEEYKKELSRILETKDLYEYYRELTRFVMLLNDGHSGVTFPNEMYSDSSCFSMLPVILHKFGSNIVVINSTEDHKERVPLYSILKKIDGIDIDIYIKEKVYPYIWHGNESACVVSAMNEIMFGRAGSKNVFTFENDGKEFEVELEKTDPSKMTWLQTDFTEKSQAQRKIISSSNNHQIFLQNDIAVIKIVSFMDNAVPQKIYECYEELKNAKGFIVDVRGNGGGDSDNADAVAALFINDEFKSCFSETQVYEPTIKAWSMFREDFKNLSLSEIEKKYSDDNESVRNYRIWRNMNYVSSGGDVVSKKTPGKLNGPIVVLMNENTVSAAEDFIDVMKMYTDAVFIGKNTAGTSGQPLFENLESGGSFRICTRRCVAQNGEDIYNKGFSPDFEVEQTLEDFMERRDAVLEKAMEILLKK